MKLYFLLFCIFYFPHKLENIKGMKPGDIDKFTIVVYLEGDDPDCTDDLIGGEMKMHMDITEEHPAEN